MPEFFPEKATNFRNCREAIDKVKLNDAALIYEPEHSQALGFGFRCGFLGILHLEIFQERLKREYGLDLIVTLPSVAYEVIKEIRGDNRPHAAAIAGPGSDRKNRRAMGYT